MPGSNLSIRLPISLFGRKGERPRLGHEIWAFVSSALALEAVNNAPARVRWLFEAGSYRDRPENGSTGLKQME